MGSQNEDKYKGISLCVDLLEYQGRAGCQAKEHGVACAYSLLIFFNHLIYLFCVHVYVCWEREHVHVIACMWSQRVSCRSRSSSNMWVVGIKEKLLGLAPLAAESSYRITVCYLLSQKQTN